MHFADMEEWRRVMAIRQATGKKIQVCLLCYRLARGDLRLAVELCSESPDSAEGGW